MKEGDALSSQINSNQNYILIQIIQRIFHHIPLFPELLA